MSSILCSKLSALYIRAQSVWSRWPVYEVKCLCLFVYSRVGSLLCLTNQIGICRVPRVANET